VERAEPEDARPGAASSAAQVEGGRETMADAPLLEAFCAGARLDPSAFCDEAPDAVLRRVGAVYREMVGGLSRLMATRAAAKAERSLDRTSLGSDHNNPVRWASSERVALDLLRPAEEGFLEGPDAVAATFQDAANHLLCEAAGLKGAWEAALAALAPAAIEGRTGRAAGLGLGRSAALWRAYAARHAQLGQASLVGEEGSSAARAYAAAYERLLAGLERRKAAP
jgi:type VI secretion system FHA domain protein